MKGEQLQNFAEHLFSLQGQTTETHGENCSRLIQNSNRPDAVSTGSAMDSEREVYFQWERLAWSRQGRGTASPSSATESEVDESEDASPSPSRESGRELKQRKLWAYRQRTMGWNNPLKWTRASFRRKLNANFVDCLMSWPPGWTSAQIDLGREEMELWQFKARLQLLNCFEGQ